MVVLSLSWPSCGRGQEAARLSLAGQTAAENRRKSAWAPEEPTLLLGATKWKISTGLDLEVNDNISFSTSHSAADVIVRPQVRTQMAWAVSENNALNVALDAGYSAYVTHSDFNRFFIGPASEFAFDVYAGDFWIRLHDRLAVTENAYEDPTVIGSANYAQLQNATGLGGTWDLNKVQVSLAYDHTVYDGLSGANGFPGGDSDIFATSAAYQLNGATRIGMEIGGGFISYDGTGTSSGRAADWNAGAFVETQVTEYIRLRASAGYTVYAPEDNSAADEFTGVYGQIGWHHRVNRHLEYHLTTGRSVNFGYYEGTIDLYNAIFEARWHFFQKLSVATGLVYEHGKQILTGQERFERFGPRLSLERPITEKLWAVLRYQFYHRESNQAGGDYDVNIVTASVTYRL